MLKRNPGSGDCSLPAVKADAVPGREQLNQAKGRVVTYGQSTVRLPELLENVRV